MTTALTHASPKRLDSYEADCPSKESLDSNQVNGDTPNSTSTATAAGARSARTGLYRKPAYGGLTGNGSSFGMSQAEYDRVAAKEKGYEKLGQKILDLAGVKLNGGRPFDMRVHNPALMHRVIRKGSLGLGEAYMEGWWDTEDFYSLHIFFEKILRGGVEYYVPNSAKDLGNILKSRLFNPQTKKKSRKVGLMHYDMGNEFFEAMLGRYMQYSCAYWVKHKHVSTLTDDDRAKIEAQREHNSTYSDERDGFVPCGSNDVTRYRAYCTDGGDGRNKNNQNHNHNNNKRNTDSSDADVVVVDSAAAKADAHGMVAVPITDLEEAQITKLRMIGEKLRLRPGMEVLDVGCGWGGLALFLVETYKVKVVGITISEEQKRNAERMTHAHRDDITILMTDYRDLRAYYAKVKKVKDKKFDRIVSVGMFEHVGPKNYKKFFKVMRSLLNDKDEEAVMVLHTIGSKQTMDSADQWYLKYIFPGGCLPGMANLGKSIEDHFVVEDVHNFGYYYALTLLAWRERFLAYWKAQNAMPPNVRRKLIETSRSRKSKKASSAGSLDDPSTHEDTSNNISSNAIGSSRANVDASPYGGSVSSSDSQAHEDREMFFRMFYYYLSSSAGAFQSRDLQLWQFVLSPKGVMGYPDVPRP